MLFEGIDFNGQEAGAAYSRNHYPPASRIPRHKCWPEEKEAQDYYKLPLQQAFRYRKIDFTEYNAVSNKYGVLSATSCPAIAGAALGECRNHIYGDDITCTSSANLRNFTYYNDFEEDSDSSTAGCGSSGMESVRNSTSEPY